MSATVSKAFHDAAMREVVDERQRWKERARAAEKQLGDANAEIARLRALVPREKSRAFGRETPRFLTKKGGRC